MKPIPGRTNSEGIFTANNPYSYYSSRWEEFNYDHPPLPCYDNHNNLVKDADVEVKHGYYATKSLNAWHVINKEAIAYYGDAGWVPTNCYLAVQPTEKALTDGPKEIEEKELYYCLSDNGDLNGLYLATMREVSEHIEMDLGDIEPSDREKVEYTITAVYMTQTEFNNLPEYEG